MASVVVGSETNYTRDVIESLRVAESNEQDFIVVPLFHPRHRRNGVDDGHGLITRSDMVMGSNQWTRNVVGKISEWIDLDNPSAAVRTIAEEVMKQEFAWASHLGLQAVVFPTPAASSPNYSRCLRQLCSPFCMQQIWVRVALCDERPPLEREETSRPQFTDLWQVWDQLRTMCSYNKQICVALDLSEDLPDDMREVERWYGEPVRAIFLSTSIFLTNQKQYPVLSKRHQDILKGFMKFNVHIILRGRPRHLDCDTLLPYFQYIRHLHSIMRTEVLAVTSVGERECISYNDTLQAPLQPLMDNLESQTYETFEKDPVKYAQYEEAVRRALLDMRCILRERKQAEERTGGAGSVGDIEQNVTEEDDDTVVTLMVVGAGRGPLVAASLSASMASGVPIRVYAVEKNRNAVVTLRNRCRMEAWDNVEVVSCDMRRWNPSVKADVMVSELLGSWGDNELSPECLDGAQVYLQDYGISIPQSYTSFIAPLSSSKLWNSAAAVFPTDRVKGLETPYVCRLHNVCIFDDAQPLFTFNHPNHTSPIDNRRYHSVSFQITHHRTIHGFSGTFESALYEDVLISISPQTHSAGMFSWFPLYIPLRDPVRLRPGDTLCVHMWRCVDSTKVWYEWYVCLCIPLVAHFLLGVSPVQLPRPFKILTVVPTGSDYSWTFRAGYP